MLSLKKWMAKMSQTVLVGEIRPYAGSSEPTGWLKCDGRAISRTTYAALFAVIGTTYGAGNGSTTFNLPDMRDRFPVGAGSSYALNAKGGANTVTLTTKQIPAHTHGNKSLTGTIRPLTWTGNNPSGIVSSSATNYNLNSPGSGNKLGTHTQTITASHQHDSVGGGAAHENRPPYIGINFLIYVGG